MITTFSQPSAGLALPREGRALTFACGTATAIAPLYDRLVRARMAPFCCDSVCVGAECHAPWVFGPEITAICRADLPLQRRLLPYVQTLFWEAALHGSAVLRPLLYHFPDDARAYQIHDQVLLGFWLMAAPLDQPGGERRPVYFPAGRWYDWWSGAPIDGPARLSAPAPHGRLPLYVRAGAIIPGAPGHYAAPADALTLDIFPGNGGFTLYEDDGSALDYAHSRFCTTSYRLRADAHRLRLTIGARAGDHYVPARQLIVRIHGLGARAADHYPAADYDPASQMLKLQIDDEGRAQQLDFAL